jgi:uncharacterized protein (DUF433 family)
MALLERITFSPKQCGGRPCIRGLRIRVQDVLDLLADGMTTAEVVRQLPDLEPDDVRACIAFASQRVGHPILVAQ